MFLIDEHTCGLAYESDNFVSNLLSTYYVTI